MGPPPPSLRGGWVGESVPPDLHPEGGVYFRLQNAEKCRIFLAPKWTPQALPRPRPPPPTLRVTPAVGSRSPRGGLDPTAGLVLKKPTHRNPTCTTHCDLLPCPHSPLPPVCRRPPQPPFLSKLELKAKGHPTRRCLAGRQGIRPPGVLCPTINLTPPKTTPANFQQKKNTHKLGPPNCMDRSAWALGHFRHYRCRKP